MCAVGTDKKYCGKDVEKSKEEKGQVRLHKQSLHFSLHIPLHIPLHISPSNTRISLF